MPSLIRILCFLASAAGLALAMPAGAVQWSSVHHSTNNIITPNSQDGGACQAPANGGGPGPCEQFSITVGGQTLKVRAYSVAAETGSQNPPVGMWATADLLNYGSSGFAIKNRIASDANEQVSPEHAVDNNEVIDILIFELPQGSQWDLEAFRLGWASEDGNARADVQLWFGGNASMAANYDFTDVCFSGCANLLQNLGGGFQNITGLIQNGGENINQGVVVDVPGTQSGRYLVMTGQLGEQNDHFKVNLLKASITPGGGSNPEPGTLALLGLGIAGLLVQRRRMARA